MNKHGQSQTANGSEIVTKTVLKEELSKFEQKMDQKLDKLESRLETKLETSFDKKLKNHKDEILTRLDDISGQLKDMRDEHAVTSSYHRRILDPEDRTEVLESIHPHGQHAPS